MNYLPELLAEAIVPYELLAEAVVPYELLAEAIVPYELLAEAVVPGHCVRLSCRRKPRRMSRGVNPRKSA